MDSDPRTDYEQAVAILSGTSMMHPTIAHLRALQESMQEHHEVCLIRIANDLEAMKIRVLEIP
jgi:hypothetical protein